MIYKINITYDEECDRWIATGDDIGIALESDSLDALLERVSIAAIDVANPPFKLLFEINNYERRFP